MFRPALLSFVVSCCLITAVEGRLFWQTYGSVTEGPCGTWNVNQDYFVPRYPTTGQYGLFSPCKTDHTTSPACRRCHPLYGGYCSPYGRLHYCWRNHVYGARCGTCPVRPYCGPYRPDCAPCLPQCCGIAGWECPEVCCSDCLPNVEAPGLQVLGAISVDGDPLLTPPVPGVIPSPNNNLPSPGKPLTELLEQQLPMLGLPANTLPSLPTTSP